MINGRMQQASVCVLRSQQGFYLVILQPEGYTYLDREMLWSHILFP